MCGREVVEGRTGAHWGGETSTRSGQLQRCVLSGGVGVVALVGAVGGVTG